ncbi:PREDICTED: GPI ethanolamine phosphate transferase 1-like [Vollenhovia emeryi]|uniref:GPI ethanolamine phosphate transferase 1-like n=1 Tax=Vollenhovia emeryi TaxID=411798 RepID=UPI0005F413ED|nr:PREDICTED: GPI ethanolamine phosphate transferase 1-like [Vollenhovia emeryi]
MFTRGKRLSDNTSRELSGPGRSWEQWIETGKDYLFVFWGLTLHLVLLWGVLDVNFHSPVIRGLPIVPAPSGPPAKRLLLFVADGLRFQTFIEKPPPYLRDTMKNRGVWGISHTRVPTESRPGHVAMAAGLYEDPSAIFKGWRENPVDFDSVFNQSHAAWTWGSPDIIPLFTKGSKQNVHGRSYPSAWQDFDANLSNETTRLDSWVFDAYLEWLRTSAAEAAKSQNGVILFFHLLGCDTLGHAKKPHSREYVENMNYVDRRIEEAVNVTERFFGNDTAYIFTSDHGMTDWGSHGSGLPTETETPLIVWGAGIKSSGFRQDIEQASIAPLIASLIGIPIPINNEGALPWQYFDMNYHDYVARSLLSNVKQLAHQVTGNRAVNCENMEHTDWRETQIKEQIRKAEQHLGRRNVMAGIRVGNDAISFSKEALSYFRQYQRVRFLICLSIMWLGWIIMLFFKITGVVRRQSVRVFLLRLMNVGFPSLLVITLIRHLISNCHSWRLPYYASFAIISAWLAITTLLTSTPVFVDRSTTELFIDIGGTLLLLVMLFVGLTYRFALSVGILLLLLIRVAKSDDVTASMTWSTLALCVFPLLPVVEPYPRVYIVIIGVCIAIAVVIINEMSRSLKIMEILRLVITSFVCMEFIDGRHWISWIILLTTPLCIWFHPIETKKRTLGIMFGLLCPLTLLSSSYEPIFFMTLTINLLCWLQDASPTSNSSRERKVTEDLIKAAFFMLYVLLCFFGTGNMASISSFDPSWTRHFVTVFSPFLMTSLILLKLSIPLILVGCVSYSLESEECTKPISLAVLFLGDCLSLPLMYCVTPHGSWLDIGSAISKFIIAISLPCLFVLLRCLSRPLMKLGLERWQIGLLSRKKHIV